MKIQFLGATETVTGSKYFIETSHTKFLVDCGLFQGHKALRLRNWAPLPINPAELRYVLLTHAHIDHSGYIPALVKAGFRGKILCTEATRDLCRILLPDSGHLSEEEARYANRHRYSKHQPASPLYTRAEAEEALHYFHVVPYEKDIQIDETLTATFYYAGHILGASFIRLKTTNTSLLFSGDLGRAVDPMMYPPAPPPDSDFLVIESTYGDRLHDTINPALKIKDIILRTVKRGGSVIIPAFAVGRAQSILYYIHQLKSKKEIPDLPVYVDSPMATDATKIFSRHMHLSRLSSQEVKAICGTASYINSVEESMQLDRQKMPLILISASGMATGGRILHHIRHFGPDHRNTILFSGYQVPGTRGDRMLRGESEVKMLGQMVPIRAEICALENISAHADYSEMLAWLSYLKTPPVKVFLTHGRLDSAQALKEKIESKLNWKCIIPSYLDTEVLNGPVDVC
jgi:metallo-beta-lactamase family protein